MAEVASTPESQDVVHTEEHHPSAAKQLGIDLNAIGKSEARKIMSEEHKALGFRPPHGSLAAEAQAAAAKHPQVPDAQPPPVDKLKEAARIDAQRILAERKPEDGPQTTHPPEHHEPKTGDSSPGSRDTPVVDPAIDLTHISEADARRLMSHEHRALGFRPPPGSLAAEAQAAASKHPHAENPEDENISKHSVKDDVLREAAYRDAERIRMTRELDENAPPPKSHHTHPHKKHPKSGSSTPPSASQEPSTALPVPAPTGAPSISPTSSTTTATETIVKVEEQAAKVEEEQVVKVEEETKVEVEVKLEEAPAPVVEESVKAEVVEAEVPASTTTESVTSEASSVNPVLERSETTESVQIIGDVLA